MDDTAFRLSRGQAESSSHRQAKGVYLKVRSKRTKWGKIIHHLLLSVKLPNIYKELTKIKSSWVALVVKNLLASAGDVGDAGSVPAGGNGNPLQYSCLEDPMDRGLQSIGSQRVGDD